MLHDVLNHQAAIQQPNKAEKVQVRYMLNIKHLHAMLYIRSKQTANLALEIRWFQYLGKSSPTVSLVFSVPQIVGTWCTVHAASDVAVKRGSVFTRTFTAPHVHFLGAHFVVKGVIDLKF